MKKNALAAVMLLTLLISFSSSGRQPSPARLARQAYRRALQAYKEKNYTKALRLYLTAIRYRPNNWRYLHNTGCLYKKQLKNPDRAIHYLSRAVQVERRSAWSLLELGGVYYDGKQFNRALQAYSGIFSIYKKLQKQPPYWAYHMIAATLVNKLNRPRAARPFVRGLLSGSNSVTRRTAGLEWLGKIEYRLLQFKKAFGYYRRAAAILEKQLSGKPNDKKSRWQLARLYYYRLKQINRSARHIRILLQRHPQDNNRKTWQRWHRSISPKEGVATFTYASKNGFDQNRFFLLPVDNNYQRHISVRFLPRPKSIRLFHRYGNRWAFLRYANPEKIRKRKRIQMKVHLRFTPRSIHQGDRFTALRDDTPDRHRDWERGFNPEYVRLARKIVGRETDRLRKAWLIHEWLCRNFTYKIISFSTGNEHLYKRLGECGTWAATSVALMQAAGIPARFLGMHIAKAEGGQLGTHIGSEFYHPEHGWVPIDNTGHMFGYMLNRVHPWRSNSRGDHMPHYTPLWASNTIRWLR